MTLNPYLVHGWASSPLRWATATAVTIAFAIVGRLLRGVTNSGAAAGGLASLLLFVGAGPPAFFVLAILFAMTWLSTRLGYRRKHELGLAERREGRNGKQVLANLGVAGVTSLLYGVDGNSVCLVATVAALAEAATDTVASEIGQTYGRNAVLITTGKLVPSGTDGGLTLTGTLCGAAGGLIITAVAAVGGIIPRTQACIPAGAGLAGMFVDSLMGATFQRRGWMSNEAVNFWSTLISAVLAYSLAIII